MIGLEQECVIKKRILLKEVTLETLSSSSIHAIPNIVRNKFLLVKLMWSFCLVISICLCGWVISNSITDYFKFDVVSKIRIDYQDRLIFPIVSICNLNMFSTQYSREVNYNIFKSYNPPMSASLSATIWSKIYYEMIGIDKKKLGFSLNDFMISCKFSATNCDLVNDFEHFYDSNYGNCFRFNSGKNMLGQSVPPKYIYQNGAFIGLELELFIGSALDNNNIFSVENGFHIMINNETVDSFSNEGIKVPTGYSMQIMLNSNLIKKMPRPYSECLENLNRQDSYDSIFYRKSFKTDEANYNYHYNDCIYVCLQKYIGDTCNCQSGYMNFTYYDSMQNCDIPNSNHSLSSNSNCAQIAAFNFAKSLDYKQKCDCPIECEHNFYTYTFSMADYPTYQYYNYLINSSLIQKRLAYRGGSKIDYNILRQSVAKVVIFYDELKQTVITEDIKTSLSDIISNIGGTLGLFLGLSFLSLVEFFEILLQTFLVILKNKNNIK